MPNTEGFLKDLGEVSSLCGSHRRSADLHSSPAEIEERAQRTRRTIATMMISCVHIGYQRKSS